MLKVNFGAVEQAIREVAATEIMPRFRNLGEGDIAFKTGDDPVTIADKSAELALSNHLLGLLPRSKVVGEEAFASNQGISEAFFGESPVWIIDPIDGTRNFVAGKPVFGVIVALAERNQTVAGWLYDPTSDEFVTAEKGAGAWFKGQRLKTLSADKLENMRGSLGERITAAYEASEKKQGPIYERTMMAGCHEYARLIINAPHFSNPGMQWHFRASLMHYSPWDDAAGVLIHHEAGGYAAHMNGDLTKSGDYGGGLMVMPDQDSWHEMHSWIGSFCELPINQYASKPRFSRQP